MSEPQSVGNTPEERSNTFWSLRDSGAKNVFVAWYLSASVAYYHWNESFMLDDDYDMMCFELYKEFDNLQHPHKSLLDRDALLAGSAYHLKESDYPLRVRQSTWAVLNPRDPMCRNMPRV